MFRLIKDKGVSTYVCTFSIRSSIEIPSWRMILLKVLSSLGFTIMCISVRLMCQRLYYTKSVKRQMKWVCYSWLVSLWLNISSKRSGAEFTSVKLPRYLIRMIQQTIDYLALFRALYMHFVDRVVIIARRLLKLRWMCCHTQCCYHSHQHNKSHFVCTNVVPRPGRTFI